jgi:hypothetical protein
MKMFGRAPFEQQRSRSYVDFLEATVDNPTILPSSERLPIGGGGDIIERNKSGVVLRDDEFMEIACDTNRRDFVFNAV